MTLSQPAIYITRDIERALGLWPLPPGYFIISNQSSFAKSGQAAHERILLIDEEKPLATWELLAHPKTAAFLAKHPEAGIVVFKNTPKIERLCSEHGYTLLNPSAALAGVVEGKISQIEWLEDDAELLPLIESGPLKLLTWPGEACVLQFNTSHTGSGTHMLATEKDLQTLTESFPDRPARLLRYINGPVFTNNNVVTENDILIGNISYQITGLVPFTSNRFATIGNDWALPKLLLKEKAYAALAERVGKRLQAAGWRGAFGIDVLMDEDGMLWLLEINARQPASTVYESALQAEKKGTSTFAAHLQSLLGQKVKKLAKITEGAQLFVRRTETRTAISDDERAALAAMHLTLHESVAEKEDAELLRVQTPASFMEEHGALNPLGQAISDIL